MGKNDNEMGWLYQVRDGLMKAVGLMTAALFAMMTVVGTWQITSRYVFNRPSTVSEELLTYSFAWMALLASAYVFGKDDHMRMSFLADKLRGKGKLAVRLLIHALIFAFALVVMVYGGTAITRLTMTQVTASLQIPMGYVYAMVPVTGALIMYFSLVNALDVWRQQEKEQEEKVR